MGNESRAINGFRALLHRKNTKAPGRNKQKKLTSEEAIIFNVRDRGVECNT
jgi:hypothetical protein